MAWTHKKLTKQKREMLKKTSTLKNKSKVSKKKKPKKQSNTQQRRFIYRAPVGVRRSPRSLTFNYLSYLPELVLEYIIKELSIHDQLSMARSCPRLRNAFYGLRSRLFRDLDLCLLSDMTTANVRLLFESSGDFMQRIYGPLPSKNRAMVIKLIIQECTRCEILNIYSTTLRHNTVVNICNQIPAHVDVYLEGRAREHILKLNSHGNRVGIR